MIRIKDNGVSAVLLPGDVEELVAWLTNENATWLMIASQDNGEPIPPTVIQGWQSPKDQPSPAGASADSEQEVQVTGDSENGAAGDGCCVSPCSDLSLFQRVELGEKVANVMPIDGSVNLGKLLRHYRELVTDLWIDLNMLKNDEMTLKVATSSFAFEQAQLMVNTGFGVFVIEVLGDQPSSLKPHPRPSTGYPGASHTSCSDLPLVGADRFYLENAVYYRNGVRIFKLVPGPAPDDDVELVHRGEDCYEVPVQRMNAEAYSVTIHPSDILPSRPHPADQEKLLQRRKLFPDAPETSPTKCL